MGLPVGVVPGEDVMGNLLGLAAAIAMGLSDGVFVMGELLE